MMGDDSQQTVQPWRQAQRQPAVWLLIAWVAGTALGGAAGGLGLWWASVGALLLVGMGLVCYRRFKRLAVVLAFASVACVAMGWWQVRVERASADHLQWVIDQGSQLVDLEGRVEDEPYIQVQPRGQMGQFSYAEPSTRFTLAIDRWFGNAGSVSMSGHVTVKLPGADWRVRDGDRIRVQGWLKPIIGPSNPGERDRRWMLAKQGITGQVLCKSRGNWQLIEPGWGLGGWWSAWRGRLVQRVRHALHDSMANHTNPAQHAMLEAMLLGKRDRTAEDLDRSFRRTGQAHLLSISGLHVGVIALGAWALVLVITGRPVAAAVAALVAVGLYMLVVPMRVPMLRAGLMTSVCFATLAWGRRHSAIAALALAGVGLLIWRPWDLFEPGFQLSFAIVAGLLLFVGPVADWLDWRHTGIVDHQSVGWRRWLINYIAVSCVAFIVALPLVIFHFGLVSPYAPLVGLLVLPLVMLGLWVGFATIVFTLTWPPLGEPFGWLLGQLAGLMERLVEWVAALPGAWFDVPLPSVPWTIAAIVSIAAMLGGAFARRYIALAATLMLLAAWLVWPAASQRIDLPLTDQPAMRLHMIDVGDGSCFVVRSRGHTWMFDCGSAFYASVGRNTVVPTLRSLGVLHIDTLVVSHADVDHFNGVIDVAQEITVGRVITHRHVIEAAQQKPWSSTGYLVEQLKQLHIPITCVQRGWSDRFGDVDVRAIWPPAGVTLERDNDMSVVLSFETAGRRLLLSGDIQDQAMNWMMKSDQFVLNADICDLPHHGSFCQSAPDWVRRVSPRIVLQSTGRRRLENDRWADQLADRRRLATPWTGLATVEVADDGTLRVRTYRQP